MILTDIRLDPKTHDIQMSGNTITLHSSATQALAQKVKIALLTKRNEWFVDVTYGVPFFQYFFNKQKGNKAFVDNFVIQYVNSIEGVRQVTSYSSSVDASRTLRINLTVQSESGELVEVDVGGLQQ